MGTTNSSGVSSGTLPNGMQYAQSVNQNNGQGIRIGGGYLYLMPTTNLESMPDDSEIETPEKNVGIIQKGFTIDYKPKVEAIYDQFGDLVSNFVIREDVSVKTGVATWNQNLFSLLSPATTYKTNTDTRTVFTGTNNQLTNVLVRFVQPNPAGDIRFTMVGQGGKGFNLAFDEKALTIDVELESIKYFTNFIAEIRDPGNVLKLGQSSTVAQTPASATN